MVVVVRLHPTLAYVSPEWFEHQWRAAQAGPNPFVSQLWDTQSRGRVNRAAG